MPLLFMLVKIMRKQLCVLSLKVNSISHKSIIPNEIMSKIVKRVNMDPFADARVDGFHAIMGNRVTYLMHAGEPKQNTEGVLSVRFCDGLWVHWAGLHCK